MNRVDIGMVLRKLKNLWQTAVDVCYVSEATCDDNACFDLSSCSREQWVSAKLSQYERFKDSVKEMGLEDCWLSPPLLKGKEVMAKLGIKPGPVVGLIVEEQVKWQLGNPEGTAEECLAHLSTFYGELTAAIHK